ncbi:MAG: 5-oxoprolinase subunit PxpB [Xanthomonadaceae bacterium]|nr:5-oxoprolinase subunit PxpB [Xanthomonadaceae bacterium]MDE2256557.1 5-oxoprolinase subunit PxpB [Xanthomonadaceae bacterium]
MNPPRIEALGDCALLILCGDGIDASINARALAIAHTVEAARLPGVLDVAPAYASVCVRYEPGEWIGADAQSPFERLAGRLSPLVDNAASGAATAAGFIEIPVTYGGESGPDLDAVAAHARLSREAVIALHSGADYRVAMLGFTPGFAYLLGLPAALHMPRRATPRTRVPAGSVAIGGAQTGVYPRETPGGWHLIGRTTLDLFDPARDPPALLVPGTRVKFVAQ